VNNLAITFDERAQEMGLDVTRADKGLYSYEDRYGEVIYRQLHTAYSDADGDEEVHPTDDNQVPIMGIFTKSPEWTEYQYAGYVSQLYKFIGNDVLNDRIRESIMSVGIPIMTENTIMSYDYTRMRNEIIIQNGQNVANVGDVLPVMIVNNSYNGTRAASVAFGITMMYNQHNLTFGFNLGEMRQIHIANANTSMSSAINSYMQIFTDNIVDMITQNFASRLTEDEMLSTLDLIEDSFGKKRRESISEMLDELQGGVEGSLPTTWQMFLAIVRYSSFEPNLNVKRMMENAAESVLVIPTRMYEVLGQLQNS
jgi:hypothetical protein